MKVRGNSNAYNVYKLEKPIFTSKVRLYVLGGHSSIDEIELYARVARVIEAQGVKGWELMLTQQRQ